MRKHFLPYEQWLASLRFQPESLNQSPENPIQEDRLPDTSKIQLEYPVKPNDRKDTRRYILGIIFLIVVLNLYLNYAQHATFPLFYLLHSLILATALTIFLYAAIEPLHRIPFWLVLFFGAPTLGFVFASSQLPFFHIMVAGFCTILLADRLARHRFYLYTTAPVPLAEAARLRKLFRFRLFPLFFKPVGVDFYWLGILLVPIALYALFTVFPSLLIRHSVFKILSGLYFLTPLLLLPFLLEIISAFLTKRRYIGPWRMIRHFFNAVIDWLSYNRQATNYPGAFRSPSGSARVRGSMTVTCIILIAAAFIPPFKPPQYHTPPHELSPREIDPLSYLPEKKPVNEHILSLSQRFDLRMHRRESIENGCGDPYPELAEPTIPKCFAVENIVLEPYQKALVKRMSSAERDDYLQDLARKKYIDEHVSKKKGYRDELLAITETEPRSSFRWRAAYCLIHVISFFSFAFFVVFLATFPCVFALGAWFCATARLVAHATEDFVSPSLRVCCTPETLLATIGRMRTSSDPKERLSLFLGVNSRDGSPVLVPRDIFSEHAHLLGDSGSGKTSLGMTTLITQLMDFGDCSLVVLDLKGDDLALFEATREKAAEIDLRLKDEDPRANYRFRWFTNELHHSTYGCNILAQSYFRTLTPYQRADMITSAMGLQYGTDYGRAYYSDANLELLHQTLARNPDVSSFSELAKLLKQSQKGTLPPELQRAASHLHAVVGRLATCTPINVTPDSKCDPSVLTNAIDLADVFRKPQALYFHLPSLIGTTSSAEIARFVIHGLLGSAKFVGPKRRQVYLFIDEFQRIAASNLEIILQTARSMNIGVILANQTMSDLRIPGTDLMSTVRANTRFRQIFAASDLMAMKEVVESSGETIIHNRAWSEYLGFVGILGSITSRTLTETISPRLRPNDVLLASDHPLQSIVHIRRGKDYAQYGGMPFVMTSCYQVPFEVYEKRRLATWPESNGQTIVTDQQSAESSGNENSEPAAEQTVNISPPDIDPVIGTDATLSTDESDSSSNQTSDADHPFDDHWQHVMQKQEKKRRRKRPQDKYRNKPQPPESE